MVPPGEGADATGASPVWVVIAAFNESAVIGGVVWSVRRHCPSVVVVDDGSTDGTGELARRSGAWVVRHPINLGQGAALRTGLDFALLRGAEVLVTFDGDGQHRPEEIPLMIRHLREDAADVALGSRFLGAAVGLSRARRALLIAATWFTWLATGLRLTDAHNGFRAFTRQAALAIAIRESRMAHASELISEIRRLRLRVVEVPVTVLYTEYSRRKGQRAGNALNIMIDLLARVLSR